MVTNDPADVNTDPAKSYFDKIQLKSTRRGSSDWTNKIKDQITKKQISTTLYVGNLSFQTTEEQIYELFSMTGEIKRIVMGLDREDFTPCGFCFVEYFRRDDAETCMRYINGTKLDERVIRSDWDAGFIEGRQFGRGHSGGQVRDEFRKSWDPDRGGYGKQIEAQLSSQDDQSTELKNNTESMNDTQPEQAQEDDLILSSNISSLQADLSPTLLTTPMITTDDNPTSTINTNNNNNNNNSNNNNNNEINNIDETVTNCNNINIPTNFTMDIVDDNTISTTSVADIKNETMET